MPQIARRGISVLVCLALATAGCGTRWSDEQKTEMADRYSDADGGGSGSEGSGASNGGASEGTTDGVAVGLDAGGTTGGSTGGGTTGGSTGGAAAATNLPCRAKSTAPGVTDDTITIGTVTSLSGPIPGLGESSASAVQAYVAYLNAHGGVCGRQVKVKVADDGGDNAQARAVTSELVGQVLGLVAGAAGGVAGSEDVIAQSKIPAFETVVGSEFIRRVPNVFGTNPPFFDLKAVIGKFKYLHDQGARKAAIVYVNAQSAPEEINTRQKPLMQAAGLQVVLELPLPLTTLSYDSAARAVANSGADYLFFLHEAGASASMARALADAGYEPKFTEYLTAYGSPFPELAGSAGEGAISWLRSLPGEDRGSNPVLDAFLEWMERTKPDSAVDGFASDAWAAAKGFFDAVQDLPGPITRDGIVAQLAATDRWDADGFFGTILLGAKQQLGCQIGVILRGGKWQRLIPSQGFLC